MVYSIRHSSRRDSHIPLKLVYIGHNHELELSNHPRGAGFCMWYYCVSGQGEFTLDSKRIIVRPGQCMVLFPDTPYTCKALPGGCAIHLLGFTGPCCLDLMRVFGIGEPGVYQVSDPNIIPEAMARLIRLHDGNAAQEAYSREAYGLLLTLSPRIMRLADLPSEAPINETIQIVVDYLETHYQQPISLDTLAAEVHLTKEYLCVLYKREMGHTILHRLTLIRIGWARLYLEQYPEKRVCEIGRMCGFESPSYFGKKFREVVGMTPESYRRVNSIIV